MYLDLDEFIEMRFMRDSGFHLGIKSFGNTFNICLNDYSV